MLETKTDKMIKSLQLIVSKRVRKKIDRPDKAANRQVKENERARKVAARKYGYDIVADWANNESVRQHGLTSRITHEIIEHKLTDELSKNLIINATEAFDYASKVLKRRWPELEESVINLMIDQDCSYRAETQYRCRMDLRMMGQEYFGKVFNVGDRWPELEAYVKSLKFIDLPMRSQDRRFFDSVSNTEVSAHTRLVNLVGQLDNYRTSFVLKLYYSYLKATRTREEREQEMFDVFKIILDAFNAVDMSGDEYYSELCMSVSRRMHTYEPRLDGLIQTSRAICCIVEYIAEHIEEDGLVTESLDNAITDAVVNLFKMYNKCFDSITNFYQKSHFDMSSLGGYLLKVKAYSWKSLETKVEAHFDDVFVGYFWYLCSVPGCSDYIDKLSEDKELKIANWMRTKLVVCDETNDRQAEHVPSGVPNVWLMKIIKYVAQIAKDRVICFERMLLELKDEFAWETYLDTLTLLKKKGWILTK